MLAANRADHGPKHEPEEDFTPKDHEIAAAQKTAPSLSAKNRRRKFLLTPNDCCHKTIEKDGPVIEVLNLKLTLSITL